MKRAAPKGLKAAKQAKKVKEEELEAKEKDGEITIQIKQGQDDVEELEGLYDAALQELNDGNVEQATMLFRGVVHECDKMIRMRNKEIPNASQEEIELLQERVQQCPVLPFAFHLIYANALYHLSLIDHEPVEHEQSDSQTATEAAQERAIQFLDEAVSRAEVALNLLDCAECHYAILLNQESDILKIQHEFDLILKSQLPNESHIKWALELAHFCHTLMESRPSLQAKEEWIRYNSKNWRAISKSSLRA
ncbi:hypothetical protein HDV03_000761 [Kappamyces sp. JEL0829]|nr:hypothetical protein HDV03_000761 [Kappamyces sp. JEL0829]